MKNYLPAIAATAALFSLALAGDAPPPGAVVKDAGELDFKASGSVPPGAEYHLIHEDKATSAIQSLVRFPAGYFLPPHAHTHEEVLFVVKGGMTLGLGDRSFSVGKGGYAVIPAGLTHTIKTKGWVKTELMVSVSGPFDLKLVK